MPKSASAGRKPTYWTTRPPPRMRLRPRAGAGAVVAVSVIGLPEHLVEGVHVCLLVAGGTLDRHLQGVLRLIVVLPPGAVAVPGVDQDLEGLLVEQRPAVRDEVLRDPRCLLHLVLELEERVVVLRPLHALLGVDEPDRPLLRVRRFPHGTAGVLDAVVGTEVRDPDPGGAVGECPDDLV